MALQVFALFKGDSPLNLEISGDIQQNFELPIGRIASSENHRDLLLRWWDCYARNTQQALTETSMPAVFHKYLADMLARRLELPLPELDPPATQDSLITADLQETADLLLPTPKLKQAALNQVLTASTATRMADQALPVQPEWQTTQVPKPDVEVAIEALAGRVPPECFYLRFGSYGNYLWFQDLSQRFGGELSQAIQLAPLRLDTAKRMELGLGFKLNSVAKAFGDKLIKDMALIGNDFYLSEGAGIAVILQTNSMALVKASMESDRRAVLAEHEDASLQDVHIAGRTASLLSTPDNRLRSWMLVDNDYLVITSSSALLNRIIDVADGQPSLAISNTFQWVRSLMPVQNQYSVFGYLPSDFFHRLLRPQHIIELRRRLQAAAHLEVIEAANLIANHETGTDSHSIPQLQAEGLLPTGFDQRADGAQVLRYGNGWIDSLRGRPGNFLPIADVEIGQVTQDEADEYTQIARHYQENWGRFDPLFFGLRRFHSDTQTHEQFTLEAFLAPLQSSKYGWLAEQLAEPTPVEIRLPEDDILSVQMRIKGTQPDQAYYLFGGLKDLVPPDPDQVQGLIPSIRAFRAAPAYLGAWPKPDLIERLPLGLGSRLSFPDASGYARMLGGLWRWQDDQWSLLSFHKPILDQTVGKLKFQETAEVAQIRLKAANPQGKQIAQWLNRMSWQTAWKSSHACANLLDTLHQQYGLDGDKCLSTALQVLGGQLQCPLGGQFVFYLTHNPDASGSNSGPSPGRWTSSQWELAGRDQDGKVLPRPDYVAPWLTWFRGAELQVTQYPTSLSIIAAVQTELPTLVDSNQSDTAPSDVQPKLNMNIFELPGKLFGDKTSVKPADETPKRKSF